VIAYFDTSALVKLVVAEDGSDAARDAWSRATHVASSMLVYPEARAAVAAAARAGRLDEVTAARVRRAVETVVGHLALVRPSRPVLWRAGDLAQRHALRGYDAVHLASAAEFGGAATVVTSDRGLARAARAIGLRTVLPG
jgi:predicted nucleic acid-binding protein